ncbi:MAG: ABC transporter substrate-binding protein [Chloroflexi bacterium]|nr:ABC transporter substrate-binding protein [Chloroflexota bacterium]
MTRILRAISLTLALLILAQSGAACTTQKGEPPIRIAISAWAGVEPAELASQLGYFDKHGVAVKLVRFSVYGDAIEALIDGKVDAGMQTLDDSIRCLAEGKDVRVVLLTDYSFGGDGLVALPEFKSVADLRGERIGVETGTVGHLSLLKILEISGMTTDDVTIVSIPTWEIQQAMQDGQIAAGITWEPYLTKTAKATGGNILITSREYPETIITTMTVDAGTAAERPDDIQKIVAAYFDAINYIKANPQDAYMRMGQSEGISAAEFESQAAGIRYLDLAANAELFGSQGAGRVSEQTQTIAKFLLDQKVISALPDLDQLLAPNFILELIN